MLSTVVFGLLAINKKGTKWTGQKESALARVFAGRSGTWERLKAKGRMLKLRRARMRLAREVLRVV